MDQAVTQAAMSRPNWWQRNWKWFVPVGCLTMALLFLAFVGSIILIVFSAMKSTDVYKEALARAKTHPAVIEALGSPIAEGFLISGNANVNGAAGESNLAIPISGPKGKGTMYVSANKTLGQWNYSGLVVEVGQTHERIDLLQKSAPSNSPWSVGRNALSPDALQTTALPPEIFLHSQRTGIAGRRRLS